ncbi:MAG: LPXTG cell wall anchor domain-containing protein [Corynebacterium sp.]|uniref:DUF6923 family protein n=1 Tax=Corynebacterium sp. TaxID=1720 RepID=UPI0026DA8405|nr:LPXTG cell wall anchor domain-containing protein [Corynebacterium sp.]MDO5030783.1 LPXTG cell wall anchor domain-containing protein [Corynebacterium sp.]
MRNTISLKTLRSVWQENSVGAAIRTAFALVLVFALILPGLAPSGSVLSAPKADAQTAWEDSGTAFVPDTMTSDYKRSYNITVNKSGTINKIVLEEPKLIKPTDPIQSGARIEVGSQKYSTDQVQWSFAVGRWEAVLPDVPVTAGTEVRFVIGSYNPKNPLPKMTVYGKSAAPALTEVTPAAPTVADSGQCDVPKTVTIPQVDGVIYSRQDNGDTVVVTATPADGYVFPAGTQTRWEFNIAAEPCGSTDPTDPTEPQNPDPENPNFSITGVGGIELKDTKTTGSGRGPYSSTATAVGKSTFEKVVVRLEKPGQRFTTRDFTFNLNGFTEPTSTELNVIRNDLGHLEFEFYPVRNGARVPSIELTDGASFELISAFSFDPAGAKVSMDIHGTKAPVPAFPPEGTVKLPQSDHLCGFQDGVPYLKKWWRTGDNNSGATQNVSMLEIKLNNASAIDVNDPRFRVQFGNTGNNSGFMNLYYGLDFSTRVEGNSLFIIFNNPLKAPPHQYSDFHVFIPGANGGACDDSVLTIWGVDKDNPDTGTPWRKDTGTLGGGTEDSNIPKVSSTGVDGYVHLLNYGTQCESGRYGMITKWANDQGNEKVYLNGDLSMVSVDMGSNIGKVSDYPRLSVSVYRDLNLGSTFGMQTRGPGSYTLSIEGTRLLIKFNQPIPNNGAAARAVRISMGRPTTACGFNSVKLYRQAKPVPTRCEGNPLGAPIPYMGNGRAVSPRQPARELTAQERAEGHRVYVASSPTSGQGRYSTRLFYQKQGADQFVPIGNETGWVMNSLAYNPDDNWLYAISQARIGDNKLVSDATSGDGNSYSWKTNVLPLEDPCFPAGHLLQINPVTGEVFNLGRVTKPNSTDYAFAGKYDQPWPNDLWGGMTNGFIDGNGDFWVGNGSLSGSGALYKVNIDHVTGAVRWGNPGDLSNAHSNFRAEDFVSLPKKVGDQSFSNGLYAWGIKSAWAGNAGEVKLIRVDLRNGAKQEFDISNLRTPTGKVIEAGKQWGKAWTYGNGDLGFGTGSSGANATGVRIKVTNPDSANPTFELVSIENNVPKSYNTDGTSNGTVPLKTDLKVTKEFLGIDDSVTPKRLKWRATVSNLGPDGSSGFVLTDQLPAGLSDVQFLSSTHNVNVTVSDQGKAFQAVFGALKANESAALEFSAAVAGDTPARCVPNTATVVGNEVDPDPNNNTSTAECPPESPDIDIRLQKVDFNDEAVKLDASFKLFDTMIGPDGTPQPAGEGTDIHVTKDGLSGTATVTSGKTYFLVETRSPDGYSLLAEPILLSVTRGEDGKANIEFQDQKNGFPASIVPPTDGSDPDVVTIQIADITNGELPKTGGAGVGILALIGLLIVSAGVYVARRGNKDKE